MSIGTKTMTKDEIIQEFFQPQPTQKEIKMQNQLITINQDLTMSSLEIVKVINSIRKSEGNNTELRHSDFLEKVKQVLSNSAEFSAQYNDATGRLLPCYKFPKREAMLMAMSYSYTVQAAVYDAYAELEAKQTQPKALTNRELALMVIVSTVDKVGIPLRI